MRCLSLARYKCLLAALSTADTITHRSSCLLLFSKVIHGSAVEFVQVQEKLDYLRGLGLSNEQLHQVVKQFPETVGLDLEKRMKPNVELMGKQFFIKGKMLPKTLARKPQALGYAVDCEGDCQGDCTRCWSHF